jgi:hypothetical protein
MSVLKSKLENSNYKKGLKDDNYEMVVHSGMVLKDLKSLIAKGW